MKGFTIRTTPEQQAQFDAAHAQQKADILAGKLSVRWSQARAGYVIRSGRSAVLGLETFISERQAWAWLEETHGIKPGFAGIKHR